MVLGQLSLGQMYQHLQDQTGQTVGVDTEESDTPHTTIPCIEGGYQVDNDKSTTIQPVQHGVMRVEKMELLTGVDDDGVGGGQLDTMMTGTGDKHVGCLIGTAMENRMVLETGRCRIHGEGAKKVPMMVWWGRGGLRRQNL